MCRPRVEVPICLVSFMWVGCVFPCHLGPGKAIPGPDEDHLVLKGSRQFGSGEIVCTMMGRLVAPTVCSVVVRQATKLLIRAVKAACPSLGAGGSAQHADHLGVIQSAPRR